MRVADYVFKFIADKGVRDVFMVSGGGAMHLNDALGREPRLRYICNHHEQACAIAAEGYARGTNQPGVICVTTGPGGTNAITGVMGAWLDSIPMVIISGQVKRITTIASCPHLNLRQLGDQEINIIDIVQPITKYAISIDDPHSVRYHLEKAWHLATTGRKGPVWVDVPLDVQGTELKDSEIQTLASFQEKTSPCQPTEEELRKTCAMLLAAKRPVIIAGFGIRLSGAVDDFLGLAQRLRIPVLTSFNGMDVIASDNPFFAGRIGTIGHRAGNFVLQSADLLLCVGTRNNVRQVSYDWKSFGKSAKKIVVDIDPAELAKPTVVPDLPICADAKEFVTALARCLSTQELPDYSLWLEWAQKRKENFPTVSPEVKSLELNGRVDAYYFMEMISEICPADVPTVAGNGTACVALFQSAKVKPGQRFTWSSGSATMGYDLPAALGQALATGRKTVCITGDGSIQMNLQELQTVLNYGLPLKIFVLENNGYASMRQTQNAFFGGMKVGCDASSHVILPDMLKIAQAYGYRTCVIDSHASMRRKIEEAIAGNDAALCVVKLGENVFAPKLASRLCADGKMFSPSLEDMFPFLEKDVMEKNMIRELKKNEG